MDFNNRPPEWKNAGVEPSEETKAEGFRAGYKPPASYFNWFWSLVGRCIKELQEKLFEYVLTNDEAVSTKVDKVAGKGLSSNDYTTAEKTKLSGIEAGATATEIINNLSTATTGKALDAVQGKVLKESLDQCFTSVSNGKTAVAAAITDKGVSTASDAAFGTMADNISKIQTELPTEERTVTPTASGFVVTPATGKTLSKVTVSGDVDLTSGNIRSGVNIFGVNGSAGVVNTSDANAAAGDMLSGKTAYVGGTKITGNIPSKAAATYTPGSSPQTIAAGQYLSGIQTISAVPTEVKSVTPTAAKQTITPTTGKFLSSVTVNGDANLIGANIRKDATIFGVVGNTNVVNTGNATVTKNDIVLGKTAYAKGELITGTIPSKGAQTYTPGQSNQTISSGYYLSGTQTIKGDFALNPSNIRSGASIFGVSGDSNVVDTSQATAESEHILSGYVAFSKGIHVNGTMKNLGAGSAESHYQDVLDGKTLRLWTNVKGYISTNFDLTAPLTSVAATTGVTAAKILQGQTACGIAGTATSDADAIASDIVSGRTAYVNGSKITGTAEEIARIRSADVNSQTIGDIGDSLEIQSLSDQVYDGAGTKIRRYGTLRNGYGALIMTTVPKAALAFYLGMTADKLMPGNTFLGVTGKATNDATATAADIASGKTAYVKGSKVTGTGGGANAAVGSVYIYVRDDVTRYVNIHYTDAGGVERDVADTLYAPRAGWPNSLEVSNVSLDPGDMDLFGAFTITTDVESSRVGLGISVGSDNTLIVQYTFY